MPNPIYSLVFVFAVQNIPKFKWNKNCFPHTQKCHYFLGTNRTTCWRLHVSRCSCWDESASVSDSQSPGPSINVILPLRFVMACVMALCTCFFLAMQVKKQRMSHKIKPLTENVTVSQKYRGSLHTLNNSPRCVNLLKCCTFFVNLAHTSERRR